MSSFSPAAALAWKVAAYEAANLNAEYLEQEHLFIGLLSLDKLLSPDPRSAGPGPAADIAREWEALASLLEITGHDPVVLRRLMRTALRKGSRVATHRVIHRSLPCKEFFARAGRLAGGETVSAVNLFSAIMEQPGRIIEAVLAEGRQCVAAKRQTDVFLPAGSGGADSQAVTGTGFNLKGALARDIRRYAGGLGLWPPGSNEYVLTRQALHRKSVALAYISLADHDRDGLGMALSGISPLSEGEGAAALLEILKSTEDHDGPLPAALEEQVRSLLKKTEDQDNTGP